MTLGGCGCSFPGEPHTTGKVQFVSFGTGGGPPINDDSVTNENRHHAGKPSLILYLPVLCRRPYHDVGVCILALALM